MSECVTVASKTLDLKTISLPFRQVEEDCEVQVWPIKRDYTSTRSDYVAQEIAGLTGECKDATNTYVGFVQERAGPLLGLNYHIFFGQFCGRFTGAFDPACSGENLYER